MSEPAVRVRHGCTHTEVQVGTPSMLCRAPVQQPWILQKWIQDRYRASPPSPCCPAPSTFCQTDDGTFSHTDTSTCQSAAIFSTNAVTAWDTKLRWVPYAANALSCLLAVLLQTPFGSKASCKSRLAPSYTAQTPGGRAYQNWQGLEGFS